MSSSPELISDDSPVELNDKQGLSFNKVKHIYLLAFLEFLFSVYGIFMMSPCCSPNRRWRMGSGCSSIWLVEDTIGGISRR